MRKASMIGAILLLIASAPIPAQTTSPPNNSSSIGYHTVAEALNRLRATPGVVFTVERGWTIVTDEPNLTIWSFSPASYAAYPAVVKRQIVQTGSVSNVQMSVLCEASAKRCKKLREDFVELLVRTRNSLRK